MSAYDLFALHLSERETGRWRRNKNKEEAEDGGPSVSVSAIVLPHNFKTTLTTWPGNNLPPVVSPIQTAGPEQHRITKDLPTVLDNSTGGQG